MYASESTLGHLPRVQAPIHYLEPMDEKPTTYVGEPPPGVPRHNAKYAPHKAWIHDARPIARELSLESEGFALVEHTSAVCDFWDDRQVREVYYPELIEIVRGATGARDAWVFDHTRRRRTRDKAPLDGNRLTFNDIREPVAKAHADFTPSSARARLSHELGTKAIDLKERRFAIINVWRPLNPEPIVDAPLALLDARSFERAHLVASDLVYSDRVGETYNLAYGEGHRWFYFPKQNRNEVLVFKNFDSGSQVAFTPHTAFDDPGTPSDAPLRESIEARVFAFF